MFNRHQITKLVLLIFIVQASYSQTYKNVDATPRTQVIAGNIPVNLIAPELLNPSTNNASVSNSVYIRQVGNNNNFESTLQSLRSNVNVYQYGNNNESYLNLKAVSIKEQVVQLGNNNLFYDIGLGLKLAHDGQVIQNGSNQKLYWIGNNSISDRLRVTMQGNNQTVIVRNFQTP